jgi:hypothetical protein
MLFVYFNANNLHHITSSVLVLSRSDCEVELKNTLKKSLTSVRPIVLRRIKAILIPNSISHFAEETVKAVLITHVSVKLLLLTSIDCIFQTVQLYQRCRLSEVSLNIKVYLFSNNM